ncbi:MAG: ATP-binding cassette domain-containing protein [Hyphomonadaceae bacterium]|nr:ATP-binding cassette domain-containing protein [Hyphomonadaceae bacterium]
MSADVKSYRRLTLALAALAGAASVALVGSAGWFLASAAIVGAAGPAIAHAFNFLAPSAAVRFFALTRTLSRYAERVIGHDAVLAESAILRPQLFLAFARRQAHEPSLSALGDVDARVMRDVEAIEADLVQVKAPAAAAWGGLLAALIALVFVGPYQAIIVALAFAFVFWGAPYLANAAGAASSLRVVQQRARLRELSVSLERGRDEVRTLVAAPTVLAMLDSVAAEIEESEIVIARSGALFAALIGAVWIAVIMMVILSAHLQGADPAALVASVLASLALGEQVQARSEVGARLQERSHAGARVASILSEIPRRVASAAPPRPPVVEVREFAVIGDCGRPLRAGVSFAANAGEIAVLAGRSGAGKSTLLRTLLGQRTLHAGVVRIGGAEADHRADLAQLIAYAPQNVALLPGTVRENLELSAPDADDARMWEALRRAYVDTVVAHAGGLDAVVSALGEGFSGGEARRIGLARAFISGRPLLLLDEPSEGLDAATEADVMRSIRAYIDEAPGRLAIVVTHRPAFKTISNVWVDLDDGAAATA